MALTRGAHLGPYEIVSALGAGGTGEVYRARDTRLGRDVAVKILPDAFANDPDRRARFQREAKTLASLNHPNIAVAYGLEGGALMAVEVEPQGAIWSAGAPKRLFAGPYFRGGSTPSTRQYDVTADGRFLMIKEEADTDAAPSIIVVQNWLEELKQRVPTR